LRGCCEGATAPAFLQTLVFIFKRTLD